jgi:hypothetical protein
MLPDSEFPGPLPLNTEGVLDLLVCLDDFEDARGAFLTFVMVPIEPRIGEWRFAGVSRSLAEAVRQVGRFAGAQWGGSPEGAGILRNWLGYMSEPAWGSFPMEAPQDVLGPHRTVLCVVGGAPYDDFGVQIVEVPAEPRPGPLPEAKVLEGWRQATLAWVLEAGTERFGPPPDDVRTALERDSRPEDWTRWGEQWERFEGWEDVLAPPQPAESSAEN